MKKSLASFLSGLALVVGLTACTAENVPIPQKAASSLRAATYNVHYILLGKETGSWSRGDWERRKGPLDEAFKAIDADVIAFQEMESFQNGSDGSVNLTLDWLLENNPDFDAAAIGPWQEFPRTQPILYRKDRLKPLDQGWFFFSDTPDVIYSRTFNGSFPAFASWAQFEDLRTGRTFRVICVHFEFKSSSNRRLSSELVAKRVEPWMGNEPVLLLGDINAGLGSTPVENLEQAGFAFLPVKGATYHWNMGLNVMGPVDHIAYSKGLKPQSGPIILRQKFSGEWPSDHYPVLADFSFE